MAMKPTVSIETITPLIAKSMLAKNTCNFRKADQGRVSRYASEQSLGKWRLTGDAISFAKSGELLNGQHRLLAIVKSGISCEFIILRGADTEDAYSMDRGKPRTVAQWLSFSKIGNATLIAAACRFIVMHDNGIWHYKSAGTELIRDTEIIEIAGNYDSQLQRCIVRNVPGAPASMLTAIAFLATGRNGIEKSYTATWFFESLAKGEGLTGDEPVLHLRNRLIENAASTRKMSPHLMRMIITLAWNKTASGELCGANGLRIRLSGPCPQKLPESVQVADDLV